MKTMFAFIGDLYRFSKRKFIGSLLLMTLNGFTGSIGIVMLIPLLSMVGIVDQGEQIPLLSGFLSLFSRLDVAVRLVLVLGVYLALVTLQALIDRRATVLKAQIVQGYTRHLRMQLYRRVIRAEWTCFFGKRKADITDVFTTEINRIAAGSVMIMTIASQIIVTLFQLYVALLMSVPMTLIVLLCGAVIFVLMRTTFRASRQLGLKLFQFNQAFTKQVVEQLECIKESKSYGIEGEQIDRFSDVARKSEDNIVTFSRLQAKTSLIYKVFSAVAVCILFYFAILHLHISASALIVIVYIFARLWPQFSAFQSNLQTVLSTLPAFSAMQAMSGDLQAHAEPLLTASETEAPPAGPVRFENVSFRYGEDGFALRGITFEIPRRGMVALVGRSGAGKSTVVDLLLGLIKPDEGRITAGGRTIDAALMRSWRRKVGYVPQDPFLFNTTIRDNLLRFNPGATEADINEALELSAAMEFVKDLPKGLDTVIGNGGVQFSGGERQRIVLARALLRRPDVLVLDEATSALDSEHEYRIRVAVEALSERMAVVVIAHRLSTVSRADTIVVLENGQIVESGTYRELSQKEGGAFHRLAALNREALDIG